MHIRFLLGPAGSGKTFRCLTEVRHALSASPEGLPLLLVAPKQTTYQVERQFLAYPSIPGYTRLHILSFDRLAQFIFDQLGKPAPAMLDEEGRLMVLRGLLSKKRDDLKLFRASARLTGFAHQLSLVLRELQSHELTPQSLHELADQIQDNESLAYKLQDLATLLQDYLDWLQAHQLQDADCLLSRATEALQEQKGEDRKWKMEGGNQRSILHPPSSIHIGGLWVDGFAEMSEQELSLLGALMPYCQEATLTFCLDRVPSRKASWLSNWSAVRQTFDDSLKRFGSLPQTEVAVEVLPRHPNKSRFLNNPVLRHLEQRWAEPAPYPEALTPDDSLTPTLEQTLRLALCADPEAEVMLAAREILRYVRAGGRYRDVTVLVRKLDGYHEPFQRLFARYDIPFFLDRRESVSHHPLAELTRSGLRTVAFQWLREDWFAALKTGLVPAEEAEIDRLENEALARGWKGSLWQQPIVLPHEPELTQWLSDLHQRLLPPFQRLALALALVQNKPTGPQLAAALRAFWKDLEVRNRLEQWAAAEVSSAKFRIPSSVHTTVWEQMNAWVANVELAFSQEPLPLREWLPILEAGLANLTVGVIPPALDQVLIGAIDRSRNPDIKLALILGLNETVFPAPPEVPVLLTDTDRLALERRQVPLGATSRHQLSRERYYAYIACTRARQRAVLTAALQDTRGTPLNPSPFLSQVRQLFPSLRLETVPKDLDWRESEHASELIQPLLKLRCLESDAGSQPHEQGVRMEQAKKAKGLLTPALAPSEKEREPRRSAEECSSSTLQSGDPSPWTAANGQPHACGWETLEQLPGLARVLEQVRHFRNPQSQEHLDPALAAQLYGPVLRTSVSRMEQFAACPFKFFVHSGLRAEERKKFELDIREQGTFQHDVLALFHEQLCQENQRWRDITPQEARQRVAKIAKSLMASYRDGLLEASEQTRFMARILSESLQDFVETLVDWMRQQYQFEPVAVELPFGEDQSAPAWTVRLSNGYQLELYGRIDRVDLCRDPETGEALCVVVDYKSSQKQLDPILMAHGLQLQLLTYLNVMRHWPNPRQFFGVKRLSPVGVFYVNLRGKYEREHNRLDALADTSQARKLAYRHTGRFDARSLSRLDSRTDVQQGDQFNYRLTQSGEVHGNCREALERREFVSLLESVEANVKQMGQQIFAGVTVVSPFRKGAITACDQCSYSSICRIDPWTHHFRVLRKPDTAETKKH